MRTCCIRGISSVFIAASVLFASAPLVAIYKKDPKVILQRIRNAKFVFFDDQTGANATGLKAFEEMKRWGKYQLIADRSKADLIFMLSADRYKGGYVVFSGGQTGTIDGGGKIDEDRVPIFTRAAPVRCAYLTIIDPSNGEELWSASRQWGGLLTGFDSAGARLVRKLKKEVK